MKPNYQAPAKLPHNRIAVDFDAWFKPTFKQRLLLLLGYNVVVTSKVLVDRKGNEVRAGSTFRLSEKQTAAEQAANHALNG